MLSNLKISARLFLGFVVLMVLLAGLNGYSYYSASASSDLIRAILRAHSNQDMVSVVDHLNLEARRNLGRFITEGDSEALSTSQSQIAQTLKLIDDTMPNIKDPKRRQQVETVRGLVADLPPLILRIKDLKPSGNLNAALADYTAQASKIDAAIAAAIEGFKANGRSWAEQALEKTSIASLLAQVIGIVSTLAGLGIAWMTARSIIRPLVLLMGAVTRLANGQTGTAVEGVDRRDEIGPLAKALEDWRVGMIDTAERRRREKDEIAAREARQQRITSATSRFEEIIVVMLDKIKAAVGHLHQSANSMSANAEQTQRQSAAVAAATDQATANVETVSAAGCELSSSIGEISRQVAQSAETSRMATSEAADAKTKISGLAVSVQKIGDVVNLINDIAAQTNLLALNATIESARAGEAGKGFAVVANEVKHLAGQTGRATDDIANQINTVQSETQAAVAAIEDIAQTIAQIDSMSSAIASAVEQQGAATTEISRNVEQASQGTREVAVNIAGVAQAAAQTGTMAQSLARSADDLLRESATLEQAVGTFLAEVRAA